MSTDVQGRQKTEQRQRADQIAHRFFSKFALLVDDARNNPSNSGTESNKVDKWFNLETPETDAFKEHLKPYRSLSSSNFNIILPFELQVLLTIPELAPNQVLVHRPPGHSRVLVEPPGGRGQVRNILLERWICEIIPSPPPSTSTTTSESSSVSTSTSTSVEAETTVPLATVYKHALSTFRSLYTLLHILPAWRVSRRLRGRTRPSGNGGGSNGLGIAVRLAGEAEGRILEFGEPLSQHGTTLPTQAFSFDPVPHPMGTLALSVTYLTGPQWFEVDTREALLSSAFFSANAAADNEGTSGRENLGMAFTPTLARNRESQSQTQSANLRSLAAAARSPPRNVPAGNGNNARRGFGMFDAAPASGSSSASGGGPSAGPSGTSITSIAERFVVPASGSPRARPAGITATGAVQRSQSAGAPAPGGVASGIPGAPGTVLGPGEGSVGAGSANSLSSREEDRASGVGGRLGRIRKESATSSGRDLPSSTSPSPLSARRPSINSIQPFKSSALSTTTTGSPSSSPSIRHPSPLAGPSLPSARGLAFPTIGSVQQQGQGVASSSGGIPAFRTSSSPGVRSPFSPPIPTPTAFRNSPPSFTPGLNAGDRRIPALSSSPGSGGASVSASSVSASGSHVPSADVSSVGAVPARRRYSSVLSHRYDKEKTGASSEAASSGGSSAALGVGERAKDVREPKEGERDRGASVGYLTNATTDDDDISMFVQDIDSRRPLAGARGQEGSTETRSSRDPGSDVRQVIPRRSISRERTNSEGTANAGQISALTDLSASPGKRTLAFKRTLSEVAEREREPSSPSEVLTSPVAIDERLRRMNEAFRASLNGMTRRSGSGSQSSGSGSPREQTGDETRGVSTGGGGGAPTEGLFTPLARAPSLGTDGRERASALSRYMRLTSPPPSSERSGRRVATITGDVGFGEDEDSERQRDRSIRTDNDDRAPRTRRVRSEYSTTDPASAGGSGSDNDPQRATHGPTRIRVTATARSFAATPASEGGGGSNSGASSGRNSRGDNPRTVSRVERDSSDTS